MKSLIRWSKRVSPGKIRQLYESDANGMLDEELLVEIGYGIYIRCQEMLELAEAQRGRVKCRNCGNIITRRKINDTFDGTEVLRCSQCNWEIACGDYHESLLRRRAPAPYEGEKVYRFFVQQWPLTKTPGE